MFGPCVKFRSDDFDFFFFFFLRIRRPPKFTLFPYPTLSQSREKKDPPGAEDPPPSPRNPAVVSGSGSGDEAGLRLRGHRRPHLSAALASRKVRPPMSA